MDLFLLFSLIGVVVLIIAIFIGILAWNNSMAPDHTKMSPLSRSIAQTLIIAIVIAILFLIFIL